MTRIVARTLTYIGAWWVTSAITFWAVPAVAEWLRQRRDNSLANQLRNLPPPPLDLQEDVIRIRQKIQNNSRCGR